MLMPRMLQGLFGAPVAEFRVLLCRCGERWCGAHWTANGWCAVEQSFEARDTHESLCATGVFGQIAAPAR